MPKAKNKVFMTAALQKFFPGFDPYTLPGQIRVGIGLGSLDFLVTAAFMLVYETMGGQVSGDPDMSFLTWLSELLLLKK